MPLWSADFAPFTPLHALTAAAFLSGIAAFLFVAHRLRATPRERTLRRGWIAFLILFQSFFIAWHLWPTHFDLRVSLPLQMCDVVPLLAIPALASRSRPLLAIVFYWGLALCTQAFITPTVQYGPASVRFWLFWITHAQIIASALYAPIALDFVPTSRDLRTALLALLPYGLVVLTVNLALDTNYAFAGKSKPSNPTILDHLGEWPLRPIFLALLAAAALIAMHGIAYAASRRRAALNS
jgi:hypothetical integral membrane protein (TIGR02206 family)